MEQGTETFLSSDGAHSIDCAAIIVAGIEMGVVEAALKLEARFEDFGGDVYRGSGEVGDKAYDC